MNNFLKINNEDKKRIIINTSRKTNMSEAIIEKDFWVCWVLKYLFSQFDYKNYICFKGGTSLSKIYNCIERFSEDIDLAMDWSVLGIVKDEAYEERSKRQQEFFNRASNLKTEDYLKNVWLPLIKNDFSKLIHEEYTLYFDTSNS
ncbi:MAG: nucleotidyl transferase AbiEii/AbiGii toxin family protein [Erysipelotrichaceae bacterium]|nr:nucleotidyl transferase AbiEii/AbiGii toxin family protein [Erysipelotrichaceae bacterium]